MSVPDSLGAFYVHALGLQSECENRLTDLALTLEAHHNPEAATIFAQAEQIHAEITGEIEQECEGVELPRVPPWEFCWVEDDKIDDIRIEALDFQVSAYQAIDLVLDNLNAVSGIYAGIQAQSEDQAVQQAAEQMIVLIHDEVRRVDAWKVQYAASEPLPDYDPPHMPE